ncbi:uncharacterized protein LOC112560108 [Pomacea canaliculata]|uniref:uncharacterized protein LOC112560108 n=1 Tax=Pomacea canaliculata TaxID=400727 RepID=UPI000D73CFB2|nr:uncharacterized protein LOC112560108 [Pomacea canaliculata]
MNAETISVMCAAFNDFQACIADCADNPQVQQGLGVQIQTFASMCPKGPGQPKMCLEGMTCMQEINTAMGGTDIPSASFLCRSIEKLFNCLGKIKNPDCGGEENGVTFMDIKDDFLEICKDGLSRADSLTNCKDYNMCVVKNNPGMVNGSDPMKVFADIGRTSFWCTYLVHSLSCASSSADSCSLSKDLKGKLVMHERNFRETCGMQLQETKYSTPTLPHTDTSPGTITSGQRKETGAAPRLGVSSMLTTLMVMAVLLWLKV